MNEFDRAFNQFFANSFFPAKTSMTYEYPCDIYKMKDGTIKILFALAGFKKEDISVEVEKNILVLTVKGHIIDDPEITSFLINRIARRDMCVRWKTSNIDLSKIKVKFTDGILSIELPPTDEVVPKKISIE